MFGTAENNHSANCRFYLKTGACRRGERCSDLHIRPTISPTLLLYHVYHRPLDAQGHPIIDPRKIQEHFEDFYEDIFEELIKFGEIECLTVCDNLAAHLNGNVYVMFKEEDQAAAALEVFRRRTYCGNPILVEFSPVTNFRAASCYEDSNCPRGVYYCNSMHVKQIGRSLRRKLFGKESLRSLNRSVTPQYRAHSDGRGRDSFDRWGDYCGNGRQSADWHGGCNDERGRRRRRRLGSPRGSRSPIRKGYYRAHSEGRGSDSLDHGGDYHGNRRRSADKYDGCIDDRGRRGFGSPRRSRSPTRERRDRIEQRNRERECHSFDHGVDYYGNGRRSADRYGGSIDDRGRREFESPRRSRSPTRERSVERRARIEQWNREREQRR